MTQQPLYVFPEYLELHPSGEGDEASLLGGSDASTGAIVGERFMVVDTRAHHYRYLVNRVIKSYLELFRQPRAEEAALEELARQAGCPPEAIAATVRTFFQRMRRAGLLRSSDADFREEPTWALTPGQVLGEYRVGELIVEKPDVALHHAHQVGTGMPVVLKVLILRGPRASRARKLFEREFSLMAGLAPHEHVCRLLAFHPGEPCHAALEYAGSTPIHRAMTEAFLSLPERVRIGTEALAALTHLHRHGLLHGDVHSRNFMLTDEHRVKLIDFGLSRRGGDAAEEASVPHGGLPTFMPPERIEPGSLSISSHPGDMRSEVFQLGVLLHEILTGHEPFPEGVLWRHLAQAIRGQPAPPRGTDSRGRTHPEGPRRRHRARPRQGPGGALPSRRGDAGGLACGPAARRAARPGRGARLLMSLGGWLRRVRLEVDPQLRSNDCGISAVKTLCERLGVPMSRETIAAALPLEAEGLRLDNLKTFLQEHGFGVRTQPLDINDAVGLERKLGELAPCLATVHMRATGLLHYVVVDGVERGRLRILNPTHGQVERWRVADFVRRVHSVQVPLTEELWRGRIRGQVMEELGRYGLQLDTPPSEAEVAALYNKLLYFGHVKQNFGLKDEAAERAFLADLVHHPQHASVPQRFRAVEGSETTRMLTAPVVLAVRPPAARAERQVPDETPAHPLWRLLKELGELRGILYLFLLAAVLSSAMTHTAVFVNQLLVDEVIPRFDFEVLATFTLGLGLFKLFDILMGVYTRYVAVHLGLELDRYFLLRFGERTLTGSIQYLRSFTRGDLLERISDSLKLKGFFTRFFSRIVVNACVSLNSLLVLFVLNWQAAALVLLTLLLLGSLLVAMTPALRRLENERFRNKADLLSCMMEGLEGVQPIRAFNLEAHFSARLGAQAGRYLETQRKGKLLDLANTSAVSFVTTAASLLLLLLCARGLIAHQTVTLGQLLTFISLSARIFSSFTTLLEENLSLQENLVILRRYFDFGEGAARRAPRAPEEDVRVEVMEARGLVYRYPSGLGVLEGVDLTLRRGEKVLLMGANGSGKSTLVRVLAGLQQPSGGTVLVNDVPRGLLGERTLRRRVVLVSAEDPLFNDTLRFNITFGRRHSTRHLVELAKRIGFYDCLVQHPDYLERLIEEGGHNLSTGQRRKVLVLRALLSEADVLIFDEIFRGIDQESKAAIARLLGEMGERAMLFISHESVEGLHLSRKVLLRGGRIQETDGEGLTDGTSAREVVWAASGT